MKCESSSPHVLVCTCLEESKFLAGPDDLGGDVLAEAVVTSEGGTVQVDDGECVAVVRAVELQGGALLRYERCRYQQRANVSCLSDE
jgi:hypothetical protein